MPWTESSSLGDEKLFFGPKNNIYALFMILFGLFDTIICLSNLSCELWNRKLKIIEIYLNKNYLLSPYWATWRHSWSAKPK